MIIPSILNNPLVTTHTVPSYLMRRGTILVPPMNLYGHPRGSFRKSINPYRHRRVYEQVPEKSLRPELLNDIKLLQDKNKQEATKSEFIASLKKSITYLSTHVEISTTHPTDKPVPITPYFDHSPYIEKTSLFITYLDKDKSKLTRDFLKEYKVLLDKSDKELTKEEINLQKQLETFIDNHKQHFKLPPQPMSREAEEYSKIYSLVERPQNAYKTFIEDYMFLEKTKCFLPQQFEAEILRQKKGLYIIENYFNYLTEPELMEIIRRAGLTVNPDAIYEYGIVKQSEGPKILAEVYRVMQEYKPDNQEEKKVYPNTQKIIEDISKGNYYVGTIERDYAPNTLILSGQDLHMVLVVEDPDDTNSYLIQAIFTSAKDSDAIELSGTQPTLIEESNTEKTPKAQMIRFLTTLKKIPKNEFKENMKFTEYAKNTNYANINIKDKIITGIIKYADLSKNNPMEYPIDFTITHIIPLVKTFYKKTIEELTSQRDSLNKKLDDMLEDKRQKKIDKLKAKEAKILEEKKEQHYYNNISPYMKNIIDIKRILDNKIKNHMDNQENLKKVAEIVIGKEIKDAKIKADKEAHQKQLKSTNENL